jgi:indolepyruvate ferredoxin oxidoreductase beta subunit
MENKVVSILFTGVGGQGVLIATDILGEVAILSGKDVKKSEVHGVAQRGGAVVSHVRFGEKVYSPLGKIGEIDFIVGLEKLEALRYLHWLKKGGIVIVNDQEIMPTLFPGDNRNYPSGILDFIKSKVNSTFIVPAYKMAKKLNNIRVTNIIMCGVLSTFLEFPPSLWEKVITDKFPPGYINLNLKAFKMGLTFLK